MADAAVLNTAVPTGGVWVRFPPSAPHLSVKQTEGDNTLGTSASSERHHLAGPRMGR